MTKEVMVQIEGVGEHTADEQVTSASRGNYFLSEGQHCVEFSETIEGLETPLNTRLEFSPGLLRLQRTGAVETTMVFEEGTVSVCEYQSPFGMMELQMITTTKITKKTPNTCNPFIYVTLLKIILTRITTFAIYTRHHPSFLPKSVFVRYKRNAIPVMYRVLLQSVSRHQSSAPGLSRRLQFLNHPPSGQSSPYRKASQPPALPDC